MELRYYLQPIRSAFGRFKRRRAFHPHCKKIGYISLLAVVIACGQQNERKEHLKNTTSSKSAPIVLMGNSITQSWPDLRPQFFSERAFINKGISGQTTSQMLQRFQRDVIDLQPTAVVIMAGINDIAQNTGPIVVPAIAENIFKMVELAKTHDIQVVICSVLPADDFPAHPGMNPQVKVPKLNLLLQQYAKANNLIYIDYFTPMVDTDNGLKNEYGFDGVHPNRAGYAIMEPLLLEGIALLQKK